MSHKMIATIISRIVELAVVTVGAYWLWNNLGEAYKLWVVIALLFTYVFYLGVTGSNDYIEYTKGEGEDMM
ncbi:hypothetical protein ACFL3T_05370 [Patescibacteria group bacterium]